ncbi:RHS repeat-associated core domain-containing protein [Rubellicoccus peritrichatus]|uniref:RHS repeat-associated core domain-containing protein n=1 Tax=Rubellicoccus peritrichatus TaxID=3080537 RepID=A0AAQ3LBG5_9BACT|nr:RHS repeat-associated core domain-containing protein [Puniceicoccus sp. CR14]WOO43034.1 RHS repeat-associated core domain-containing protein [Puniceicoccus sp. CR14]
MNMSYFSKLRQYLLVGISLLAVTAMSFAAHDPGDTPAPQPGPEQPNCPEDDGDEGDREEPKCKEDNTEYPDNDEEDKGCDDSQAGDPFYLFSGEFYYEKAFLSQPEQQVPFRVEFRYSTYSSYNGPFGSRWSMNYNMRIYETDDSPARLIFRDDKAVLNEFEYNSADDVYELADSYVMDKITFDSGRPYPYILRRQGAGSIRYYFDAQGLLRVISQGDLYGTTPVNGVYIDYVESAGLAQKLPVKGLPLLTNLKDQSTVELVTVIRDYRITSVREFEAAPTPVALASDMVGTGSGAPLTGREFNMLYYPSGHLKSVTDQSMRTLFLEYDSNGYGELVKLTTGLSDGTSAPTDGVSYDYSYYSDASTEATKSYFRYMKTFSGEGCGDCTQRALTYYDEIDDSTTDYAGWVKTQIQAQGAGESIAVAYHMVGETIPYTDVTFTINTEDVSGNALTQYREERSYWMQDTFDTYRLRRKEILRPTDTNPNPAFNDPTSTTLSNDNYAVQYFYYGDGLGGPNSSTDGYSAWRARRKILPNGSDVYYYYDTNDYLKKRTRTVDADTILVQQYARDDSGDLLREAMYLTTAAGVLKGTVSLMAYEYDSAGQNTFKHRLKTDYTNVSGDIANWPIPAFSTADTYTTTEMRYNSAGLMIADIDANGIATLYEYNPPASAVDYPWAPSAEYRDMNGNYLIDVGDILIASYTYDAYGYLDTKTDANGGVYDYDYNEFGDIERIEDPLGFVTIREYDTTTRKLISEETGVKFSAPGVRDTNVVSRKTKFTYDGLYRLDTVFRFDESDNQVPQVRYTYDNEGNRLTIQQVTTLGALTAGEYSIGSTFIERSTYSVMGWMTAAVTPFPAYDGQGGATEVVVNYEYDAGGRMIKMVAPNPDTDAASATVTTKYEYDGRDQRTLETQAFGDPLERSMAYDYDVFGNTTKITYTSGSDTALTRFYYDNLGRQVGINWDPDNATPDPDGARQLPKLMTYDDVGNMLTQTDGGGFSIDSNGAIVERSGGGGNTTVYQIDKFNRIKGINWDFSSDAPLASYEGLLPQKMVYDNVGNALSATDGEGNTTYLRYDAMNQPTEISVPKGNDFGASALSGNWWEIATNVLQSVAYDAWGQRLNVTQLAGGIDTSTYDRFGRLKTNTDLAGLFLTYTYDNLDQIDSVIYPEVVGTTAGTTTIVNTYNSVNPRLIDSLTDRAGLSTDFTYITSFRRETVNSSQNATTTYTYNALGQLESEKNDLNQTTSYTYDQFNQRLTITYPDHSAQAERVQVLAYDAFGQLSSQRGAATYDVDYDYDLAGNRAAMTTYYGDNDPLDTSVTTWGFNVRNQMTQKTYADNTYYDYAYDDAGNLSERTDGKQRLTKYYYDAFNNLTITDYQNDGDVLLEYDDFGRLIKMWEGGTTTAGVYAPAEPAADQEWTYFPSNLIDTHTQRSVGYEVAYTYTSESQRDTRKVRPIGGSDWTLDYSYDSAGRMDSIKDTAISSTAFSYTYKSDANLIEDLVNPSNSKIKRTYDILGRLKKIETLDQSLGVIDSYAYNYNDVGLREDETLANNDVRVFTYDERRQLTDAVIASSSYNYGWGYDPIGNRLGYDNDGDDQYDVIYDPNKLNQYGNVTGLGDMTYNDNGSLTNTQNGGITYVWDEENRLVEVYDSAKRSVYTYDGLSKRIRKQDYVDSSGSWVLDSDTQYVYDDKLVIVDLVDDDLGGASLHTPKRYYTRGLDITQTLNGAGGVGSLIALREIGADSYFYYYDGNGNVTGLIKTDDTVAASYSYDPFGNVLSSSVGLGQTNPYQFSTKEYEKDWDLNYYLYRFYSPELGRWLSRDPIMENGGYNLYSFVRNQPINLYDILGLQACCKGGKSVHPIDHCCRPQFNAHADAQVRLDQLHEAIDTVQEQLEDAITGLLAVAELKRRADNFRDAMCRSWRAILPSCRAAVALAMAMDLQQDAAKAEVDRQRAGLERLLDDLPDLTENKNIKYKALQDCLKKYD